MEFFITLIIMVVFIAIAISSGKKHAPAAHSSTPEEKRITARAKEIFEKYQQDWTNLDTAAIATYTTPDYHEHASYMIELLRNLHRVNKVSQLQVYHVYLLNAMNSQTPLPANLQVKFEFSGLDEVLDTQTNKTLYREHAHHIYETWNFVYDGQDLRLSGISQPTESAQHLVRSLVEFANQNHLYYSPDWGRYALPSRGLIFGGATMKVADINNHIVGKWGDLLVQLYTYAETPGDPSSYYLVGQINVPKEYLGVIVKPKRAKDRHRPDKSYDKFELEWPDFNKHYEVYAAKRDALPAFELLNPKFMERLYNGRNLDYNLEVADNVIYIFARVRSVTEADYAELLDILKLAHQELKM